MSFDPIIHSLTSQTLSDTNTYTSITPTSATVKGTLQGIDTAIANLIASSGGSSSITLTGDVTGSGTTSVATTVAKVGGVLAATIASATGSVGNATDANIVSTLVKRDASGNFSAGTITASLNGNATSATTANTATTAINFSGSLSGDVSGTQGTTSVDKIKGVSVTGTPTTNGQLLTYQSGSWQPITPSSSGGMNFIGVDILTSSGTYTKDPLAKLMYIEIISGGQGGGSGARQASGVVANGGNGGQAGFVTTHWIDASAMASTCAYVIGSGGLGGASVSSDSTNGSNGGQPTGSSITINTNLKLATDFNRNTSVGGGTGGSGNAGAAALSALTAQTQFFYGAGSIGNNTTMADPVNIGTGPGHGGGGSGINASNTLGTAGANGGISVRGAYASVSPTSGGGGTAGTTASPNGGNGSDGSYPYFGAGGGGGCLASTTSAGGTGGAGGVPGGGGGGGSASRNGFASGAGGNGGRGEIRIFKYG